MNTYLESDEEFLDPKAEPAEDDPPRLAVEGFRTSDYTVESFHIGLRVRWVVSKTHKEWLDGYITKVAIEMGHPGCVLTIFQVGKAKQDTYKVVHFPTGVHEIDLPPVPPHLQLSQTSLHEGFSISFGYNEVWEFGWVIKLTKHTCHVEFQNGKTSIFHNSKYFHN